MKKLFVLVLLTGVVSVTSAGLDLEPLSPYQIAVTLDPAENLNFYLVLEENTNYSIELTDNTGGLSSIGGVEDYGDGFDWRFMTIASTPGKVTIAGQQMIITWLEGPWIDVQLYDATGYVALSEVMTLVPEPMTLGLLGLGALFMRRRK